LGYLSLWHFDRLSVTPVGSDAQRRFGPTEGRTNIRPMLSWLERLHAQREGDLVAALSRLVHERRRAGILLIVSDFLSEDLDRLENAMRGAIGRGWEIALLQVSDPAEIDPTRSGVLAETHQATDLESRVTMPIRGDAVSVAGYLERRAEWHGELTRLGGGARTLHVEMPTDQPVDQSLVRMLRNVGLVS